MTNHKELINSAIHNYYHDDTELEMELKDYFYEMQAKAQAFDRYLSKQKSNLAKRFATKRFTEYAELRVVVDELESYLK